MAHDVFISYSSQDKTVADAVCATLESRKIRCWIAPRDVLAGQPYAESILDGISRSRVFVLVFSSDSNLSQQVLREVERAVSKGLPILPFRIEDVEPTKSMELFLSATHWLDALTPPLEKHLQELADSVEVLLGSEASPRAGAPSPGKTTGKEKPKGNLRPIYYMVGSLLVALCVLGVLKLTGSLNGDGGGTDKNSPSMISGNGSEIGSNTTQLVSNDTGLPGQTTTPISGSTSTISPTTSTSTPTSPLVTATSVIDSSGTLTSGASTLGKLGKGEIKWYEFNAAAGDAIFAVLSEGTDSGSLYPWLELLGPDGKSLASNYGSITTNIDLGITATGKYTLRVRDHDNNGGSYVLSFMQLSKSVNPLNSGVSLQGQLKIPGDVNWYTFDANAGDAVYAVLSEGTDSSSLYPWLQLFGPDGKTLASNYGSTYTNIDLALTNAGKYTLRVRDHDNNGGNYVLSFVQSSKSVNPLTSGVSLTGKLQVPGDINWYYFTVNAGDAIFAVLSEGAGSSDLYPWLELLGPDGKSLASNYGSMTTNIDLGITAIGKYTLRVRDHDNNGGNYVLSFMQLSKPVNLLTSGESIQGQLKVPGDVNWYTFDADVGDAVYAVLSEGDSSESLYPWLQLLGPDGAVVSSVYGSITTNIDLAINKAGKYTLRVRDHDNNGGNYVLSFNLMKQ
jgi:hypothetical protein